MSDDYPYNKSIKYKKKQLERQNRLEVCRCGAEIMHVNMAYHLKTEKHKILLKLLNNNVTINNNRATETVVCHCDCVLAKTSLLKHLESEKHSRCLAIKELKNNNKDTIIKEEKEEDILKKLTVTF